MLPKRRKQGPEMPATPLDAQARALAEREAKVRAAMQKYEKLIEEAPKIAKQRAQAEREAVIRRASHTERRLSSRAALPDRRFGYEVNVAVVAKRRRLRIERRQGRLTFFVLLLVFALVLCWVYWTVVRV